MSGSSTPTDRVIRWPELSQIVCLSRSHVHNLIARGLFPRQIKLTPSGRASGWLSSDIEKYLEERTEESRSASTAA